MKAPVVALLAAGALAGCSAVFGLDAPTLDPCAQGGCVDAAQTDGTVVPVTDSGPGLDSASSEAGDGGSGEAEPDTGPGCVWDGALPDASGGGVRCGGGCSPVSFCMGTAVCCQTADATGQPSYACVDSQNDCPDAGYVIACVNENDCKGSEVCCHYTGHMVCDTSCTNDQVACIPGSADDCATGKKCDVAVSDKGSPSPYYVCEP